MAKCVYFNIIVERIQWCVSMECIYVFHWIHSLSPPPTLEGPLAVNNILEKAEHLYENQVKGPESILYHKGWFLNIYDLYVKGKDIEM